MAKLKRLEAENVKGLKSISIDFEQHGNLVVIGGPNGAGKSTVLDSVMYLFGGKSSMPDDVLRHGEDHGEIEAETDTGIIARRVITEKGVRLIVKNGQGATFASPQSVLDDLVRAANGKSTLEFDPLAFIRMSPAQQRDTLKELIGLDLSQFDREKGQALQDLSEAKREEQHLADEMEKIPAEVVDSQATEEVSVVDLLAERDRRLKVNAMNQEKRAYVAGLEEKIEGLTAQIEALQKELNITQESLLSTHKAMDESRDLDVSEIDQRITNIEAENKLAREHAWYKSLLSDHANAVQKKELARKAVKAIDQDKKDALANAVMPVSGLAFDEDGVTYNGARIENLSGAEQLMVSVGMAIAMQPELKVLLVRDGSLLDCENLEALGKIADKNNVTILLERVGDGPEVSIEMIDGEVRAA